MILLSNINILNTRQITLIIEHSLIWYYYTTEQMQYHTHIHGIHYQRLGYYAYKHAKQLY